MTGRRTQRWAATAGALVALLLAACAPLALAQQATTLLHETFRYEVRASAHRQDTESGLSLAVDVLEVPPPPGSSGLSLEVVVSDLYFVNVVNGGRMRARLPDDAQLSYSRPFYVLLGADGALKEV